MEFEFRRVSELPRLAWLAVLEKGGDRIIVYCGPWVEVSGHAFIEGAWDGEFSEWAFDQSANLMGTGGKIIPDGRALFATPCHMKERIFTIRKDDRLYLSNSIPFILSASGTEMDPGHVTYQGEYDSILRGYERCIRDMPLKGGYVLTGHVYCNIEIDCSLGVSIKEKQKAPPFETYQEYVDYLTDTFRSYFQNVGANARQVQYKPLATASKGYDSSAVAAIARDAGCEDVFTFENARPKDTIVGKSQNAGEANDDSGVEIAEILGYRNILMRDRWRYLGDESGVYEKEGCASGFLWYDPTVLFESDLEGRLFLTGHFGDVIWSCNPPGKHLEGGQGSSMAESRLRIGFIQVPVPYIAGMSHPSIARITNSQEMQPWKLGRHYDRPIPRRILEERGVPRESFGMEKKAVGVVLIGSKANFLSKMTPTAAESFLSYYRWGKRQRNLFTQLRCDFITGCFVAVPLMEKVFRKYRIPINLERLKEYRDRHWYKYNRSTRAASFLFPWGASEIKERYRVLPGRASDSSTLHQDFSQNDG